MFGKLHGRFELRNVADIRHGHVVPVRASTFEPENRSADWLIGISVATPTSLSALRPHPCIAKKKMTHALVVARRRSDVVVMLAGSIGLHHVVPDSAPVNDLQRIYIGPGAENIAALICETAWAAPPNSKITHLSISSPTHRAWCGSSFATVET